MHRLQDLVRLHRLGTRARTVARRLGMSPNTERRYRRILRRRRLAAPPTAIYDWLRLTHTAFTA
jgi:transposase-like protein